jgi:lipopolysaccharide transport system ATP-binding protein
MSQPAISIQNISKEYSLGLRGSANESFREMLVSGLTAPFRRFRSLGGQATTEAERFWALKDVSFAVNEGEVLGIIGRNGAGKSTLLKILSRITAPTSGRITMRGRLASLLEVGTGFHPELTGRENVYLNGAILGMTRAEIARKFDEIVDFAGIEKFLDTPVKRYSSGMYVRLAFSVAAHLEPEILVVDEVLAVGDAEFQKKCLGKMKDVSRHGRTVLFVSHNMNAIQMLCHRAVMLRSGSIVADSYDTKRVVDTYLNGGNSATTQWKNIGNLYSESSFMPVEVFLGDEFGYPIETSIMNNDAAYLYITAGVTGNYTNISVGYTIFSEDGTEIYTSYSIDTGNEALSHLSDGIVHLRTKLPERTLNEGRYFAEVIANIYNKKWLLEPGSGCPRIAFEIRGGLSDSPKWTTARNGVLALVLPWEFVPASRESTIPASCCAKGSQVLRTLPAN